MRMQREMSQVELVTSFQALANVRKQLCLPSDCDGTFGTYFFTKVIEEYNPQHALHAKCFNTALTSASHRAFPFLNYANDLQPEAH